MVQCCRNQSRRHPSSIMTIVTTLHVLLLVGNPSLLLASGYTILGGLPSANGDTDEQGRGGDDSSIVTETLRHFRQRQVQLRLKSHESSGRVSMAGTLWEACPLLADYITNPACPVEAFRRMNLREEEEDGVNVNVNENENGFLPPSSTVVELGSGVGLASLAAALLGCHVCATDGSPSSISLLRENFDRYADDFAVHPQASLLDWGDVPAAESLIRNQLGGRLPDVVMASDVIYAHSAREELARTIRQLCPVGHVNGRVLVAHRWRVDPLGEESFFKSFDDDFVRKEVPIDFMPLDPYFRTRNMRDMKLPVSIFEMRRKC